MKEELTFFASVVGVSALANWRMGLFCLTLRC